MRKRAGYVQRFIQRNSPILYRNQVPIYREQVNEDGSSTYQFGKKTLSQEEFYIQGARHLGMDTRDFVESKRAQNALIHPPAAPVEQQQFEEEQPKPKKERESSGSLLFPSDKDLEEEHSSTLFKSWGTEKLPVVTVGQNPQTENSSERTLGWFAVKHGESPKERDKEVVYSDSVNPVLEDARYNHEQDVAAYKQRNTEERAFLEQKLKESSREIPERNQHDFYAPSQEALEVQQKFIDGIQSGRQRVLTKEDKEILRDDLIQQLSYARTPEAAEQVSHGFIEFYEQGYSREFIGRNILPDVRREIAEQIHAGHIQPFGLNYVNYPLAEYRSDTKETRMSEQQQQKQEQSDQKPKLPSQSLPNQQQPDLPEHEHDHDLPTR